MINIKYDDMKKLFHSDADRFVENCDAVIKLWSNPYEGCYCAKRPAFPEARKMMVVPEGSSVVEEYKRLIKAWDASHPLEVMKEAKSFKDWENGRDAKLREIEAIAKRHGLYIKFWENAHECAFDLMKNGKVIAVIH